MSEQSSDDIVRVDWPNVIAYINVETDELATRAGKKSDAEWNIRDVDVESYLAAVRQSSVETDSVSASESPWDNRTLSPATEQEGTDE